MHSLSHALLHLTSQIYVQGLPPNVTEAQLAEHFGAIGVIKKDKKTAMDKIHIYREGGRCKGDATVTYEDPDAAEGAVDFFDKQDFLGQPLTVTVASRGGEAGAAGSAPAAAADAGQQQGPRSAQLPRTAATRAHHRRGPRHRAGAVGATATAAARGPVDRRQVRVARATGRVPSAATTTLRGETRATAARRRNPAAAVAAAAAAISAARAAMAAAMEHPHRRRRTACLRRLRRTGAPHRRMARLHRMLWQRPAARSRTTGTGRVS